MAEALWIITISNAKGEIYHSDLPFLTLVAALAEGVPWIALTEADGSPIALNAAHITSLAPYQGWEPNATYGRWSVSTEPRTSVMTVDPDPVHPVMAVVDPDRVHPDTVLPDGRTWGEVLASNDMPESGLTEAWQPPPALLGLIEIPGEA